MHSSSAAQRGIAPNVYYGVMSLPHSLRYDDKSGPLAAARRLAMGVPGQILVNTAAFTLPEELHIGRGWRLLDVSCGRASLVRVLAHRVRLDAAPVGLDASRDALTRARQDMEAEGGPPTLVAQGTTGSLPFADETFHLLLSAHSFRHLTDEELRAGLSEARRVLKPGGLFLAWEFAPTPSGLLNRWNRWVLTRDAPQVRLRSYSELRVLAHAAAFDWVERARLRPFLLPPIPRVSLIMGKAPDGWSRPDSEGQALKDAQ